MIRSVLPCVGGAFEVAWFKPSGLRPQGPEVMTREAWRNGYLIRVLQDRGYVVRHESKADEEDRSLNNMINRIIEAAREADKRKDRK